MSTFAIHQLYRSIDDRQTFSQSDDHTRDRTRPDGQEMTTNNTMIVSSSPVSGFRQQQKSPHLCRMSRENSVGVPATDLLHHGQLLSDASVYVRWRLHGTFVCRECFPSGKKCESSRSSTQRGRAWENYKTGFTRLWRNGDDFIRRSVLTVWHRSGISVIALHQFLFAEDEYLLYVQQAFGSRLLQRCQRTRNNDDIRLADRSLHP